MAEVPGIYGLENESQTYAHSRIKSNFAKLVVDNIEGIEESEANEVINERTNLDIEYLSPDKLQ